MAYRIDHERHLPYVCARAHTHKLYFETNGISGVVESKNFSSETTAIHILYFAIEIHQVLAQTLRTT